MPQRAMVAAQGPESSGGINLAAISRDVGGGGVELSDGVQVSRMESSIDGGGPGDRPRSRGAFAGRTDEEIQIVFDRYKAALYRLYNRALRKDPTLRGEMVLRLTIEPDGTVSLCNVQSSDLKAPELSRQVVDSVTAFQFGAKEVPPVTIVYPIDFLPTA
jgi:TonB family protein